MELRGYGFLLLFLHTMRAVIALEKIIVSKPGENTTLSCIYRGRKLHLKNLRVYWQIDDDKEECTVVHALISGQDNESKQCIHFKNRTRLFWDRLENGDFSLLLLNVSQSDEHTYKCIVLEKADYTSMVHHAEVVLSLADTQQKRSNGCSTESHKNLKRNGQGAQAAGIVSIVILIGVLAVIIC
ncbi:CD276 antigen-like isoform X1 [Pezoporus occidentalis]|uniref:CD276 antigen-like isoform X1 n=1 Tax=Pezoporus occidentalis TaxID=407982 RepID=UPI002F90D047